jgi:hypothetical protein
MAFLRQALHRRAARRRRAAAWGAVLGLGLGLAAGAAALADGGLEYAVKAAYLYKFAPFVDWPASAFPTPASPFTVCVFGEDPFGSTLDQAVRGQVVAGRSVLVRRMGPPAGRVGCQVLYIGRSSRQSAADELRAVQGLPILTVTDEAQGSSGGVVQFVLREGHVRFALDADQARAGGLELSSKLMALAVSVKRSGP